MAQTGSAQREPSMEEILASIRRIIQDSDPAQQQSAPEPEFAVVEAQARALPQEPALREVEAFRAELDEPVSLDVDLAEAVSEPQFVTPPAPESFELEVGSTFDMTEENKLMADHSTEATEAPAPQDAPATLSEAEAADPRPAIISDHAGRQVAAAFGELNEAFAASRRRSFDEMAQDMLRPMLQEWLDDNLPTLVERLVREEIERVARGG